MAQHREELWKLSSSVHFEESEIEDRRRKIFADEAKLMGNMIDRCFIGFNQMHDKLNDLEARQTQTHVMITCAATTVANDTSRVVADLKRLSGYIYEKGDQINRLEAAANTHLIPTLRHELQQLKSTVEFNHKAVNDRLNELPLVLLAHDFVPLFCGMRRYTKKRVERALEKPLLAETECKPKRVRRSLRVQGMAPTTDVEDCTPQKLV